MPALSPSTPPSVPTQSGIPRGINPSLAIETDGIRVCALGENGKQLARPAEAVRVSESVSSDGSFELTLLPAPSWDKSILTYFIYDRTKLSVAGSQLGHPYGAEAGQVALVVTTHPGVAAVGIVPIRGKFQSTADSTDWAAKLRFSRSSDSGKRVALAPTGSANKVTNLVASPNSNMSVTLTWTEKNVGDYNNDGEVNIADLQPVAAFYTAKPVGPNDPAYMADGNLDGEVNIVDLQPLAQNFLDLVTGYNIYRVAYVPPAVPDFSTPGPPLSNLAPTPVNPAISIDRATSPPAYPHLVYSYVDPGLAQGDYAYIVRPYSKPSDSPSEGTASNYSTAHVTPPVIPDTTPPVWQDGNVGIMYTTHDAASVTVYFWRAIDADSPPVKYNIYWAQGVKTNFADLGPPQVHRLDVNESDPLPHSYQVTGLTPGTVYTFGVRAEDSATTPNEDTNTNMVSDSPGLDSGWPYFHLDPARTGASTENIYPPLGPSPPWTQTYGINDSYTSTSPVIYGSQCIIGSNDGHVISFDAATGALIWSYSTGFLIASTPAVSNGRVFIGNTKAGGRRLYCLDAYSGAFQWWYQVGDDVLSSPVVSGNMVYFGSQDKNVYALDVRNAALKWKFTADNPVSAAPTYANGVIYVGSTSGRFYALNATGGGLIWMYPTGGSITGAASVSGGKVFVPCQDGNLYCFAAGGTLLWTFPTGGFVVSTPAIVDGTAYFGSMDRKVYAVDVATGTERWHYTGTGRFASSPAVTPNGILFIGGDDNKLYIIDTHSGARLSTVLVGNHVYSSPAIYGHRVYFASSDAILHCYEPVADTTPPSWDTTVGITDAVAGDSEVTVKWGHATDSQRLQVTYNVYYSTDPAMNFASPGGTPATTVKIENIPDNPTGNSLTITGLTNGSRYYFAVRCQDGYRTADASEPQPNEDTNTNIIGATPPWLLMRIPAGGIPMKASFAFDSTSTPHVSFSVQGQGLFHAYKSGPSFQIEPVYTDLVSGVPFENDIDTHSDVPYIAYNFRIDPTGAGAFDLHEIDKSGGPWTDHAIDQSHQTGRVVSLGMSSSGDINIGTPFVTSSPPTLVPQTFNPYAYSTLTGLTAMDVDPSDTLGSYVAMAPVPGVAAQHANYPAIAYNLATASIPGYQFGIYGQLNYAEWNGMTWDFATVDNTPSSDVGKNCSMAWNPTNGLPGIIYLNLTPPQWLRYAERNAVGNWQTFPIVAVPWSSSDYMQHMTSLAYDQNGFSGTAYWDKDPRGETPIFMYKLTASAREIIDEVAVNPAYDASIKVHFTSAGLPAVVYCDVSNSAVVYALRLVPPT